MLFGFFWLCELAQDDKIPAVVAKSPTRNLFLQLANADEQTAHMHGSSHVNSGAQRDEMVQNWAEKLALSKVGNPYQLARMFRKYDTEDGKHGHTQTVLIDEFVQVMIDGHLGVPRRCVSSNIYAWAHACVYMWVCARALIHFSNLSVQRGYEVSIQAW